MLNANELNWNREVKLQARVDTIIDEYRRLFHTTLPTNQQYWTMCSQCATEDGQPQVGSEYDQIIKSGLIQPSQWHGVDINPDIIALNKKAYPEAHWYSNDFYRGMASSKKFRPGIVNIDTMYMAEKAAPFVAEILDLCSKVPGELMVVCNVVTQFSHIETRKSSIEDFMNLLKQEPMYRESWKRCEWKHDQKMYVYKRHSEMSSVIFYKSI